MSTTLPNLDRLAAQHAQSIINHTKATKPGDVDNTITKALGVLQENGVYACILYLKAKEKDNGNAVVEEMLNLLDGIGFGWGKPVKDGKVDTGAEAVLQHITDKVTVNLERLLLAKETLEHLMPQVIKLSFPCRLENIFWPTRWQKTCQPSARSNRWWGANGGHTTSTIATRASTSKWWAYA